MKFKIRASAFNLQSAKLDRHRGDRYGNISNNNNNKDQDSYYDNSNHNRHSRGPSRFSDGPPMNRYNNYNNNSDSDDKFDNQDSYHHRRRSPSNFRVSVGGGGGGGHRLFNSPPRQHHSSGGGGGGGGFRPIGGGGEGGGGGFQPMGVGFEGNYRIPPPHPPQPVHAGQKRPSPFSGLGGGSPSRGLFYCSFFFEVICIFQI